MKISTRLFRKVFLLLVSFTMLISTQILAQGLTGIKTINPSGSGPNNFISLKMAIDTLNFYGVGTNGVTFQVSAGMTETAPTGGYVITATGTQLNPIVFVKSGSGSNPEFLSYTGGVATNSSAAPDGILELIGSDYITFDGLSFTENPANVSNPSTMEFGIGLFKQNATNGCQNNTIKNCKITLNRINNSSGSGPMFNGSIGILIINSTSNAATTNITPTSAAGSNSFNKIYSNTIENVNIGIALNGFSTSTQFAVCDYGNDIGGNSENTGNTVINFGGGGTTNASSGIQVQNNYDFNVSYNTINNNNGGGVNHGNAALRGIFCNASATSASGVVSNNTVTVKSAGTTTAVYAIDVQAGSTAANNTINVNNNKILNCSFLTATSGTFYGINVSTSAANVNINNNIVRGMDYSSLTLAGSGTVYGITNGGATPNLLINNNSVSNITSNGTTGNTNYGIFVSSGVIQTVTNDSVYNININGTGTAGTIYGIATSTGTVAVNNNNVFNLFINKTTGTSPIYGIYNLSSPTNENYNNNIVHHLTHAGAGIVRGIYTFTTAGVRTVSGNTVYTLSNVGAVCEGINQQSSTPTISRNKVYDITSFGVSGNASGITITSGSTSVNIFNNFVSDIKAPAASLSSEAVRGINITNISATTDINVSHNTVYINPTSTGTNFGSAALFHTTSTTATTARLILRNNILINKGVANGTGFVSAYRRSSSTLTNFSSNSNRNIFYAGIPSTKNLIFYDGTNSDQTLSAYQTRVSPRDNFSHTEDVSFVNPANNDLHVTAGLSTLAESAGTLISSITSDIDGQTRPGPVGSVNGGGLSSPDIGADEFDGIPLSPYGDITAPAFSIDSIVPSLNTCLNVPHVFYVKITDASPIDTAIIIWTRGNAGNQTPINFINISGNRYYASIPSFLDSTINYSFRIVDASINKNTTVVSGGTYKDVTFSVNASASSTVVSAGTSVNLRVSSPLNAQLGTATTTNTTSSNAGAAYPTYYGNGRQQYLITAAELSNLGFTAGDITSLGFFVTALGTGTGATLNGYTIKMSHTTATNLSAGFQTLTATQTFGPVNYTPALGLNTHTFTTPFTWNGSSNVIVDICFSNQITGSTSTQNINRTSATSFVSTAYYQADGTTGSGACTITTTSATASVRPNMYFTGSRAVNSATWSTTQNGGLQTTNGVSVNAIPQAPGTYVYQVVGSNGTCSAQNSVTVTALAPAVPIADFTASSTTATTGSNTSTVTFTDISQNLPSSWRWVISPSTFNFVNSTNLNSKNPQVQFTATGNYTVKLVVSNVTGSDSITKLNYVTVTPGYCTTSLHTTASVCIDSVIIGTINNSTGTSCSLPSYTLQTATTNIMRLAPTSLFVKTSASAIVSVWIDYNQNGIFESSEWTQVYTTGTRGTKNIIVPSTAKLGQTMMRIRSRSTASANSGTDACTSFSSGETEDYPVTIINTVGDYFPPNFAANHTINPPGGACTPVAHTISIGITDTTGVDSAFLIWSLNGVNQTPLLMSNSSNIYSATIPAQAAGASVAFSFLAKDSSPQKNTATKAGGFYTDATFRVKATTSADSINIGSTVQLGISNPIIRVGNGTTNNSTSSNAGAAYPTYYGNGRQQYLILASELSAIGLTATNLNSIAFDVSTIGTGTGASLNGYTIKIGNTSNNTLSGSFNTTALTTVFTAPTYTPVVGSNVHSFSTPYFWDGTSNLIVDICFSNGTTGSSTTQNTNKTHTTTFPSSVFYQVDGTTGSGACNATTVSSSVSVRPNMLFTSVQQSITYTWSVRAGGNLSSTTISNPTATPTSPGTYFYRVVANNGSCNFTDSVRVKVINPTPPTANFTASITTGFTNSTVNFTDQTSNLPNSWRWSFSPNTVTYLNSTSNLSQNPSVSFNNAGLYSVKLVATNTAGVDSIVKASYIRILASPCTSSLHSSSSSCLSLVSVNTLNSTGGTCAVPSYSLQSATTTLSKLVPYPLTVTTSAAAITSVWIDFNQNGTFETTEWWQVYTTGTTGTINITIPVTALPGYTLMRVRSRATGSSNGAGDACTAFASGETRDYIINVVNPVGDYYPPNISNIQVSPASSCTPVAHTISVSVFDTTGVDTVQLKYAINGIAQSPITMNLVGGNIYSASIPSAGSALVSYSIYAVDNSAQKNKVTSTSSSYRDAKLKATMTVGADVQIPVGGTAQLGVQFPFLVGSGTNVYSLSNGANIFDRFYGGKKTQYLYTASELQAAGLVAGPINSISFFANTNQLIPTAFPDFSIEMKAVTLTTLTGGTFETGGINVFGPSSVTPNLVNGKLQIPFSTPFTWDGVSNLLVSVVWNKGDAGTTTTSTNESLFIKFSTTTSNSVVFRRVDNAVTSTIAGYTTGGTNSAQRANIEFGSANTNYTYSWTQPSNGGLSSTNISNPSATPSGGVGTYQYIVNVNDGSCNALDTVNVIVVAAPVVDLGPDGTICGSTPRNLDAGNPGSTYAWTYNGSAFGTTQTVQAINPGVYKVTVTNASNITVSDSITLSAAPEFTLSIPNQFLCQGGSITVNAGTYSSYLWSTGATTPSIQITSLGNYSVTVKNAGGCIATANFIVSSGTPPVVNLGPNRAICKSNPVTLNAGNAGSTYLWSTGATTQSISVSNAGSYWVKVTNNAGCSSFDTVEITNLAAPVVNLGPDKTECSGLSITLDAGNPGATYVWNTGATTRTINVTTAGIFTVTVTNSGGCSTKDTIVINRLTPVTVNLGTDRNICTSDTITLDAGNSGATYLWSTGATTKTIKVSLAGTYSVTVTNSQGCKGTDELIVTNKPTPNSVFTFVRINGRNIQFNVPTAAGQTYRWNFGDPNSASNTSALPNPIHEFSSNGSFIVSLVVTNISTNCVSTFKDTIDIAVGLNSQNISNFNVNIYPNPITNKSVLTYNVLKNNSNVTIEVYNTIGQKVYTLANESQSSGKHEIDLSGLMNLRDHSILFINMNIDGNLVVKKVILSNIY